MLFHNIVHSDDKRTIKTILQEQEKEKRKTTWYSSLRALIEKYEITLNPQETLKSMWKKHVKEKITEKTEEELREKCCKSRKSRFVCEDKYETKAYLLSNASL